MLVASSCVGTCGHRSEKSYQDPSETWKLMHYSHDYLEMAMEKSCFCFGGYFIKTNSIFP